MNSKSEVLSLSSSPTALFWFLLDTTTALFSTLVCLLIEHGGGSRLSDILAVRISLKNVLLLLLFLFLWALTHQLIGLHRDLQWLSRKTVAFRGIGASLLGSVFFLLFPLFSHNYSSSILGPILIFFAVASLTSLSIRWAGLPILPRLRNLRTRPATLLIVGSGPLALRCSQSILATSAKRFSILGFVDSNGSHPVPPIVSASLIGGLPDLESILMTTQVDEVLIALPFRSCYDQIQAVIGTCELAGVPVTYNFQPFQHTSGYSRLEQRAFEFHLTRHPSRLEGSRTLKRLLDFLGASCCLVLSAPLFLVIAWAIRLDSKGPVFFSQNRYGKNKRLFRMFKFRTMVPDAEALQNGLESQNEARGPVFKMKRDPRVTRVGRFLRKTSLDELPQLFNVLKGDMSLVGPRPLPTRDVARFSDSWLMRRFSVKPGLTCLWQVRGRSSTSFDQWIEYDLEYIDTWSPALDAKILFMTIPAVLRGSGAM